MTVLLAKLDLSAKRRSAGEECAQMDHMNIWSAVANVLSVTSVVQTHNVLRGIATRRSVFLIRMKAKTLVSDTSFASVAVR